MENTSSVVIPEDAKKMSEQAASALTEAGKIVIINDEQFSGAAEILKGYKKQAKELTAKRKEMTGPLDASKKVIMDFFREPLDFLNNAEKKIKAAMIGYQDECDRKRREEEKRLQELEEKRIADEKKKAEKRAKYHEKKGNEEKAEEIREEAEMIPETVAPTLADTKPKAAGISTRETWSGEVTDKMALIKAVAAGQAPETLIQVDTKVLNQMARAMKAGLKFPGVKAVASKTIAGRTG